jgi:hypothetical protein
MKKKLVEFVIPKNWYHLNYAYRDIVYNLFNWDGIQLQKGDKVKITITKAKAVKK